MLGNQSFNGVATELTATGTWEYGVVILPTLLVEPGPQCNLGLFSQGCATLFSAFPFAAHVAALTKDDVFAA